VNKGRKTTRTLGSKDYSSVRVDGEGKEREKEEKRNRAVQHKPEIHSAPDRKRTTASSI